MNQYEIIYKHMDMHPDYTGYCLKWARDKAQAIKYLAPKKPDKSGYTTNKKGARIKIIEVNQLCEPSK